MPRKIEPSFKLKQIIWDLAATAGTDNYAALLRQVDEKLRQLHKNAELYEDETPDARTLRRIIERDIQHLTPEVVIAKLPRHTWHLRSDHEDIEQLAERTKEQRVPADEVTKQELISQERHLGELAKIADILAYQVNKLLRYKDDGEVEVKGNIFGRLLVIMKSNPSEVVGLNSLKDLEYERQLPINKHLANWLYDHYEYRFGSQQFMGWDQLSRSNVSHEIIDNLNLLAHGGLKYCPNCKMCKEVLG
ncbi:hypothetical protein ACFLVW_02605 [Chloroflexota bacterium]